MPYLPDYRSIGSRYMMWKWLLACSSSFPSLPFYIYIYICSRACPPYYPVLTRARNFINRVSHVCCLLFEFAHNVVFKLSTLDGRLNSVTNEKRTQRDAREYIYIYVYVCNEYSVDFSIIFSLVDYERMYRRARRTFLLPVFEKTKRINLLKNAIFNSKNKFIIIIVYIYSIFSFLLQFLNILLADSFQRMLYANMLIQEYYRIRDINETIQSNYFINMCIHYILKRVARISTHISFFRIILFV